MESIFDAALYPLFDYVKFRLGGAVPVQVSLTNRLIAEHASYCAHIGQQPVYRKWAMVPRSGADSVTFLEFWGPSAEFVKYLDWDEWSPRLQRVDVKRSSEYIDEKTVLGLHSRLINQKGTQTLSLISSKSRSKRKGRDAGGTGLALGAHKSDLRVTVYRKPKESGSFEGQMRGRRLSEAVHFTDNVVHNGHPNAKHPWIVLKWEVIDQAVTRFCNVISLEKHEVAELIRDLHSGRAPQMPLL